jgi:hypothetical protein
MSYIINLIEKVDQQHYGFSVQKGLSEEEQKMRNKALISLLYLSARRISELVGRKLVDPETGKVVDVWEGIRVSSFQVRQVAGRKTLIMRCRILKKGRIKTWRKKGKFKIKTAEVELSLEDKPFIDYVLEWLRYVAETKGADALLFDMDRTRAFQILRDLDSEVWNHWLRHQRLSHLGEFLNPYQLRRHIGFWESLEPALAYVHGRERAYFDALRRARQSWK